MGFLDFFRRSVSGTYYARVKIGMDFDARLGAGDAAVRWETVAPHPRLSEERAFIALAGLHYGRILCVHEETRADLFARVGKAARSLVDGAEALEFEDWQIEVADRLFIIWPWTYQTPETLYSDLKPKTYISTLVSTSASRGERVSINLKMAMGLERILAPASALLVLDSLSRELGGEDLTLLGKVICAMNNHYGTADASGTLLSEVKALEAVLPLLCN